MSTTKRNVLLAILVLCIGWAAYTFYTAWRLQDPAFQRERTLGDAGRDAGTSSTAQGGARVVDLDELALLRPKDANTREILPLEPIRFAASVKQEPQEISTRYLMEALDVISEKPLPEVSHRMFVETAKGHIMPVYVQDDAAHHFKAGEAQIQMTGYHVYTYSKGPAILVVGVIS